jgi:hypothetical protein
MTQEIRTRLQAGHGSARGIISEVIRETCARLATTRADSHQTLSIARNPTPTEQPLWSSGSETGLSALVSAVEFLATSPAIHDLVRACSEDELVQLSGLPAAARRLAELERDWSRRMSNGKSARAHLTLVEVGY